MIKLIVLDRDGVINEDSPSYIKSPQEWRAIPGSLEAIAKLKRHGYKVAIATNQAGLARRLFTAETLALIHKKMIAQLKEKQGEIDAIFICPHAPEDNCSCRKPKPGLLLQATNHFNVKPEEMLMIGDSLKDLLAAKAHGAPAILVKTGNGKKTLEEGNINVPTYIDLTAATDALINNKLILTDNF